MKIQESELYEPVKKFIENRFKCFFACREAGIQRIGSVDVFGVHHKNAEKSEIETIGVEVKIDKIPLSANFGQARGYSVFCDKMYFASLNIDEEDLKIARFLGIGLIKIEGEYPDFVCSKFLEAPTSVAITEMRYYVLKYKRVFQCESCKVFQHYQRNQYVETESSRDKITNWTKEQVIKKDKGLRIGRKDRKEFYCNKCAKNELKRKT